MARAPHKSASDRSIRKPIEIPAIARCFVEDVVERARRRGAVKHRSAIRLAQPPT
jgi:hypothetical protein